MSEDIFYNRDQMYNNHLNNTNKLTEKVIGLEEELGQGGGSGGIEFLDGASNPSPNLGEPGSVYLNTTTGDLFKKEESTWVVKMNLVGARGEQGIQGEPGRQGEPGEQGEPGRDGADGVVTQEQYNDIIARLGDLEARLPE